MVIYKDIANISHHDYSPVLILKSLWNNWDLIIQLVKRDITGRYRGSLMGLLWSFAYPLLMLTVYTMVFGVFLKAKWAGTQNSLEFSIFLFAGLLIFNFFAECVNRAPSLIISNPNYVKKVVFPLEVFPWIVVGSSLFHTMISFFAWIIFYIVIYNSLNWTIIFFPVLLLPLTLIVLGLCWFLSAANVFVRDIAQIITIVTQVLLFLSPIFYAINTLPTGFQNILLFNPLTFIVEQTRAILILGELPAFSGLTLYTIISLCIAWLGLVSFQRMRDGFADVL